MLVTEASLTVSQLTVQWRQGVHSAVPPSPPSVSRTYLSSPTETPYPLDDNSPDPLPTAPDNRCSTFVAMALITLGTSNKWNHKEFGVF